MAFYVAVVPEIKSTGFLQGPVFAI